jgi:hypothetical protein
LREIPIVFVAVKIAIGHCAQVDEISLKPGSDTQRRSRLASLPVFVRSYARNSPLLLCELFQERHVYHGGIVAGGAHDPSPAADDASTAAAVSKAYK